MHRFFVRFTLVVGIALLGSVSSHAGNLFATDGVANWQGVYVGIHGGAGLGSAGTLTTGGTLYGAHGGMNTQSNQLVGGLEGDYDSSSIKILSSTESFTQSWLASGRARGGIAFGNNLAYGTLGLAMTQTNYTNVYSTNLLKFGTVYGGGLETLATPNIVLRGEFLHYEFGPGSYLDSLNQTKSLDTKTNVFRFGIAYKF